MIFLIGMLAAMLMILGNMIATGAPPRDTNYRVPPTHNTENERTAFDNSHQMLDFGA